MIFREAGFLRRVYNLWVIERVRGNKGVLGKLNRFAHQLNVYFLTGALPIRQSAGVMSQLRPKTEAS